MPFKYFPGASQPTPCPLRALQVAASLQLFNTVCGQLLPRPEKCHYTFNLRDVSKVFQGISMAAPERLGDDGDLLQLWCHECQRTFADRLVDDTDRSWFTETMDRVLNKVFKRAYHTVIAKEPLIFADFMEQAVEVLPVPPPGTGGPG